MTLCQIKSAYINILERIIYCSMAWLCCDEDGTDVLFVEKPSRNIEEGAWVRGKDTRIVELRKGASKQLLGRSLTWKDEPVEI